MAGPALPPRGRVLRIGRTTGRTIWAAAALCAGLALAATAPARADSEMKQSPLLMRRAGPSCRPGDLGAEPGAGYRYRLGPCAGANSSGAAPPVPAPRGRGRRRDAGL